MFNDVTNKTRYGPNDAAHKSKAAPFTVSSGTDVTNNDDASLLFTVTGSLSPREVKPELAAMRQRVATLVQGLALWAAQSTSSDASMVQREVELVLAEASQTKALIEQAEQMTVFQEPAPTSVPLHMDTSIFAAPRALSPSVDESSAPSRRPMASSLSQASTQRSSNGVTAASSAEAQCSSRQRTPTSWPPADACVLVAVEFKRQRVHRYFAPTPMEPGAHVLVPGDRGFDCGLVVQCGIWNPAINDVEPSTLCTMDAEPVSFHSLRNECVDIIREASPEEVSQLYTQQASKERLALKTCRDLVVAHHLDMDVVDCEYQFDGSKISFFFEATQVIDFRALNKDLFRNFNARIWLENVNNTVRNHAPRGAVPRAEKTAFRHQGVPFPRH